MNQAQPGVGYTTTSDTTARNALATIPFDIERNYGETSIGPTHWGNPLISVGSFTPNIPSSLETLYAEDFHNSALDQLEKGAKVFIQAAPILVGVPGPLAEGLLGGEEFIGPAYESFEEAFGQGEHVMEVLIRNKQTGEELASWWEASEKGMGFAGHTEQKALGRILLDPSVELEFRGFFPPCPYAGGCMNTMTEMARQSGVDITYRTPRSLYFFSGD